MPLRCCYRFIPLVLVVLLLCVVVYFDGYHYISFTRMQQYQLQWLNFVANHEVLSVLVFMLCYIIVVVFMIPGVALLTMLGGYSFGFIPGVVYVLVAATIGASCSFLMVQYAVGSWLAKKHGTWVERMQHGFQKNALSYLLFLRLVPLFPFPVVNVVPGILNIKKSIFFTGTFFGIMPGVCVYAWLGKGLFGVASAEKEASLWLVFNPHIFLPVLALGLLSLCPILYKYSKKKSRG